MNYDDWKLSTPPEYDDNSFRAPSPSAAELADEDTRRAFLGLPARIVRVELSDYDTDIPF